MSTCDLLSVTPAELVVNPRPFRLEGLKPWNCLTPNGHKADKSGPWPYFYLITTNINGHEVVNVDALVLIAMTRRHLISFAYVSCPCVNFCPRLWSNLYFCHSQNSQKIGHSLLSKSLPHDNIQLHLPSKSSSANFQSFCSTRTVVKEVLARHILMSWIFATSSIFPNHSSPQNLSPI